jgi:hypothetical protein
MVGESEVVVISGKLGMSPNPRGVPPRILNYGAQ